MTEYELADLYTKYYSDTYRFAFSFTYESESAKDIVSDSWMKIVKNIKVQMDSSNIVSINKSFIMLIVRNTSIDYLRKEKLRKHVDIAEIDFKENLESNIREDNTEKEFDRALFLKSFLENMKSLGEVQQETIRLKFFSDFTNKEIAEIQKVGEKTVSSNISKALKKIKLVTNI